MLGRVLIDGAQAGTRRWGGIPGVGRRGGRWRVRVDGFRVDLPAPLPLVVVLLDVDGGRPSRLKVVQREVEDDREDHEHDHDSEAAALSSHAGNFGRLGREGKGVEKVTVRGRYAPSPTGHTHLGNASTALL